MHYEAYEFHKLEEVEYFYLVTKKYYFGKAFSRELGTKLENNKFTKSSCGNGQAPYFDLTLQQVIPPDLIDSFFHQITRRLLKEEKLKEFMETDSFL
jgi:hypothetical protein